MYTNLIQTKNSTIALIKERAKIIKMISDLEVKNTSEDTSTENFKSFAVDLFNTIQNNNEKELSNDILLEDSLSSEDHTNLEDLAKEAYKKETGEEYSGKDEEEYFICDKNEFRVFEVDNLEEMNLLREVEEEELENKFSVELKSDKTVRRCMNIETGDILELLELEYEEG